MPMNLKDPTFVKAMTQTYGITKRDFAEILKYMERLAIGPFKERGSLLDDAEGLAKKGGKGDKGPGSGKEGGGGGKDGGTGGKDGGTGGKDGGTGGKDGGAGDPNSFEGEKLEWSDTPEVGSFDPDGGFRSNRFSGLPKRVRDALRNFGPGVATYDPEDDNTRGKKKKKKGIRGPGGPVSTPNPEGPDPIGPMFLPNGAIYIPAPNRGGPSGAALRRVLGCLLVIRLLSE